MPTTPPCPLPTKIPLEPKTQIKEKKKKKKPTRSLPHPTHLNPKDKNQSMPQCKTHTKPTQNPDRWNHLTYNATRSTPTLPTSHHIQPIIGDLERNHHRWHWQPTNLHRETHQSPPRNPPIHRETHHCFPPIHRIVHRHAIQRHHHGEIKLVIRREREREKGWEKLDNGERQREGMIEQ